MMMTHFSVMPPFTAKALLMPRKVAETETVETKAEATEPKKPYTNTPNVALPIGLGAGAALIGGIGSGQGYWEFAPKAGRISKADALAIVNGHSALKASAQKELEALRVAHYDAFIEKLKRYPTENECPLLACFLNNKNVDTSADTQDTPFNTFSNLEEWDKMESLCDEKYIDYEKKAVELRKIIQASDIQTKLAKKDPALLDSLKDKIDATEMKVLTEDLANTYAKLKTLEEALRSNEKMTEYALRDLIFLDRERDEVHAYKRLGLKDTPTVQNLAEKSLKTATQQVDGFMKYSYAKAEDLEKIGGEALVKRANASKIALGIGAVVAGLGTGIVAYTLINKKQPTSQASKST